MHSTGLIGIGDAEQEEEEEGDNGEEEEEEEDEDEDEEEEEEPEEPEDPKPAMVERSFPRRNPWVNDIDAKNNLCPAEKHHFDACAARVAKAVESPQQRHGHAEDCAEEFLHLMHCVDKQIAEPLFKQLR